MRNEFHKDASFLFKKKKVSRQITDDFSGFIVEFQSSPTFKQGKVKEGAIEGALAGTSRPGRSCLIEIVKIVLKEPGIKINELQERLKISERTVTSDIKRFENYINYKGSKKGGGYEASNILLNLMETKTAD